MTALSLCNSGIPGVPGLLSVVGFDCGALTRAATAPRYIPETIFMPCEGRIAAVRNNFGLCPEVMNLWERVNSTALVHFTCQEDGPYKCLSDFLQSRRACEQASSNANFSRGAVRVDVNKRSLIFSRPQEGTECVAQPRGMPPQFRKFQCLHPYEAAGTIQVNREYNGWGNNILFASESSPTAQALAGMIRLANAERAEEISKIRKERLASQFGCTNDVLGRLGALEFDEATLYHDLVTQCARTSQWPANMAHGVTTSWFHRPSIKEYREEAYRNEQLANLREAGIEAKETDPPERFAYTRERLSDVCVCDDPMAVESFHTDGGGQLRPLTPPTSECVPDCSIWPGPSDTKD